jgi:hypothetical protein
MNKKLILPLVIGAGIIGLYFLMKNKKSQLVSVAPLGPPRPQPTATTKLIFDDTGEMAPNTGKGNTAADYNTSG